MKVVVAPDSFKGSITACDAAMAVKRGVLRALPEAEVTVVPMSDGGEGTIEAFLSAVGGEIRYAKATGPLGNVTEAFFGVLPDGACVIEAAAASGLTLVPKSLRDPLKATSCGVGELIQKALDTGCKRLIVGLGGSATCDGGIGMLGALGVKFFDHAMRSVPLNGAGLAAIHRIDASGIDKRLANVELLVMCDVVNPLYGKTGAAYVFAPQKGADPETVERLDRGLANYCDKIRSSLGKDISALPGGGAAGGLGAAFAAFLNAPLVSGFKVMRDTAKLEEKIRHADLVITGEGRTDFQTLFGKVPAGIAAISLRHHVPCVCISGALDGDLTALYQKGMTALFSICNSPMTLEDAIGNTADLLSSQAENIVRLFAGSG